MSKQYSEMTAAELEAEIEAWFKIMHDLKGPNTPPNSARSGAERLMYEAQAWLWRAQAKEKKK